jgi:hypothetical protein
MVSTTACPGVAVSAVELDVSFSRIPAGRKKFSGAAKAWRGRGARGGIGHHLGEELARGARALLVLLSTLASSSSD